QLVGGAAPESGRDVRVRSLPTRPSATQEPSQSATKPAGKSKSAAQQIPLDSNEEQGFDDFSKAAYPLGERSVTSMTHTEFTLTDADFKRIAEMVYQYCGINLHDGKRQLVHARIAKQLRTGGHESLSEYLEHVKNDSTGMEFTLLIDAMSTNLTSFYREPDHFR